MPHPITITHVKSPPPPSPSSSSPSGKKILVDRIYPRGQRKASAPWDEWLKAVAPSTELRRWYGHDPDKYEEFVRRYRGELLGSSSSSSSDDRREEGEGGMEGDVEGEEEEETEQQKAFKYLEGLHSEGGLTLMTATRELGGSQARVLGDLLGERDHHNL